MQATIDSKKKGDYAFRQKDFSMAIDCYSQVAFDLPILFFFFFVGSSIERPCIKKI